MEKGLADGHRLDFRMREPKPAQGGVEVPVKPDGVTVDGSGRGDRQVKLLDKGESGGCQDDPSTSDGVCYQHAVLCPQMTSCALASIHSSGQGVDENGKKALKNKGSYLYRRVLEHPLPGRWKLPWTEFGYV